MRAPLLLLAANRAGEAVGRTVADRLAEEEGEAVVGRISADRQAAVAVAAGSTVADSRVAAALAGRALVVVAAVQWAIRALDRQ